MQPTVSEQIVLQCVLIKLVLSDLSETQSSIAQSHDIFRLLLHIIAAKYSMHGVILDAKLGHWYNW